MNQSGLQRARSGSPFKSDGRAFLGAVLSPSNIARLAWRQQHLDASHAFGPESMGLRREPVLPWAQAPARIYTAAAVLALGSMLLLA